MSLWWQEGEGRENMLKYARWRTTGLGGSAPDGTGDVAAVFQQLTEEDQKRLMAEAHPEGSGMAATLLEAPVWWIQGRGQRSYLQVDRDEAYALTTVDHILVTFSRLEWVVTEIGHNDIARELSNMDFRRLGMLKLTREEAGWFSGLLKTAQTRWLVAH